MKATVGFALLIVVTQWICFGCAADKKSREFAGRLNRVTLAYEAEVAAKADAEREFYLKQLNNLSYVVAGRGSSATEVATSPIDDSFNVKATVAYGLIATSAQDDATRVAEMLIAADRPQTKTAIIKFLADGVEADMATYLNAQHRREQLQIELLKGLEVLDLRKQELKSVRDDLARLERQPDLESDAKSLAPLIEAVRGELNKPR